MPTAQMPDKNETSKVEIIKNACTIPFEMPTPTKDSFNQLLKLGRNETHKLKITNASENSKTKPLMVSKVYRTDSFEQILKAVWSLFFVDGLFIVAWVYLVWNLVRNLI